jgi:hypothetical protein
MVTISSIAPITRIVTRIAPITPIAIMAIIAGAKIEARIEKCPAGIVIDRG